MPLRDHFRTPQGTRLPWESIHSGWIGEIAGRLNELLPNDYVALDRMRIDGGLEIDIGVAEGDKDESPVESPGTNGRTGTALATARAVYTPPPATGNSPFDFPDVAEVRVFTNRGEGKLVGAIELVSPGNKDRDAKHEAFVAKCLDYLAAGACVVVIDVVTERRANLHNEIVRRIGAPADVELPGESHLYAVTYRPVVRKDQPELDLWVDTLTLGELLPTMPLRLFDDYFVPVELERTYTEACRRRKLL
jgi:hypothetical protein